jgi:hypothetical protein
MANGPVFGIRPSQPILQQTIQIIASTARQVSANIRARRELDQRQKQFNARQQEAAQVMTLREENLKLQQERLAFEVEREGKIEEERKSKQEARTQRASRGEENEKLRRAQVRISAFRALKAEQQSAATNSMIEIDKEVSRTTPLVRDQALDADFLPFNDWTAQRLAGELRTARAKLTAIQGDEFRAGENPSLVALREQEVDVLQRALDRRTEDINVTVQSRGHQFAPDPIVRNNLLNALSNQIFSDLDIQQAQEPTGEGKVERAAEKGPAPTAPAEEPQAGAAPVEEPPEQMAMELPQRFVDAEEADDQGTIQALRQEVNNLPVEARVARYFELQKIVGTARADALMFGTQ